MKKTAINYKILANELAIPKLGGDQQNDFNIENASPTTNFHTPNHNKQELFDKILKEYCNKEFNMVWDGGQRSTEALPSICKEYFDFISTELAPILSETLHSKIPSVLDVGSGSDPIILILRSLGFTISDCTITESDDGFITVSSLLKPNNNIHIIDNTEVSPLKKTFNLAVYMGPDFLVVRQDITISQTKTKDSYHYQKRIFDQIVSSLNPEGLFFVSFHTPIEYKLYLDFVESEPSIKPIVQSPPKDVDTESSQQSNNCAYMILKNQK